MLDGCIPTVEIACRQLCADLLTIVSKPADNYEQACRQLSAGRFNWSLQGRDRLLMINRKLSPQLIDTNPLQT